MTVVILASNRLLYLNTLVFLFLVNHVVAQEQPGYVIDRTDGSYMMTAHIKPNGDTVIDVLMREVLIAAPRQFADVNAYKKWDRYKYYAPTVVSYAAEAVKTFRELEAATRDKSKSERKAYIKMLEDKLESKMRMQMKNLTRTQGLLLTKMIERELHMPFYDLVKDLRGGFQAFYWNEFGKVYGYNLKEGYIRGNDPLLDNILDQYDLSYYVH